MNTLNKSLFKTSGVLWGATSFEKRFIESIHCDIRNHTKVDRRIYQEIYKVMPDVESLALSRVIEASIRRKA